MPRNAAPCTAPSKLAPRKASECTRPHRLLPRNAGLRTSCHAHAPRKSGKCTGHACASRPPLVQRPAFLGVSCRKLVHRAAFLGMNADRRPNRGTARGVSRRLNRLSAAHTAHTFINRQLRKSYYLDALGLPAPIWLINTHFTTLSTISSVFCRFKPQAVVP